MITLESNLRDAARGLRIELAGTVEPFAHASYAKELTVKRKGLQAFFRNLNIDERLVDELVQAPLPRGYRTTSRRRIHTGRGPLTLVHGDGNNPGEASVLEPPAHAAIYSDLERLLEESHRTVEEVVNHVILRGTYQELALIVNVREMDSRIVRTVRRICERLAEAHPAIQHAWMYHDPKGSRFYLELERPATGVQAKRLFGHAAWRQEVAGISYQIGVFSFSQINLAMIPQLLQVVGEHANVSTNDVFYDLYSGYGLFGASLATQVRHVVAVDADEATIDNARYNVKRAGGNCTAIKQVVRDADDMQRVWKSCNNIMRPALLEAPCVVLLDPPRSGTPQGMIRKVAEFMHPRRAVEVLCGPDEFSRTVKEWRQAGYRLCRVTPVDLFPGTFSMELVASFEPAPEEPTPSRGPSERPRRTARQYGQSNNRRSSR